MAVAVVVMFVVEAVLVVMFVVGAAMDNVVAFLYHEGTKHLQ